MNRATKIIAALALAATGVAVGYLATPRPLPATRLATLSGQSVALADLRGKVVLVNFWATSCDVCVAEMPKLVQQYNRLAARGFDTVAVAMSYDHPNAVAGFAQGQHLPFKVALDTSGELAQAFRVMGTPTSVLLDRHGKVLARFEGEPDWRSFDALVEKSLADPA
ncbi:MAG: TlpA family protein disulfide reductase [Clostridia bacterium]